MIREQYPQWAELPLTRMRPGGSDHIIYRLGDAMTVRFPRHSGAVDQARLEARWLPRLAGHLPLAIPTPIAVGEPYADYPWHWAVHRWLDGSAVTTEEFADSTDAVSVLTDFLAALRSFPVVGGPPARPLPLPQRDAATRSNIEAVSADFDSDELTRTWEAGLNAAPWAGRPLWCHGDFHAGNLLATGHKITAVIDFGGLSVGDPANDLLMAFTLFTPALRQTFRRSLQVDEPTWLRARAWALTTGLTAYTAYAAIDPAIRKSTTRQIRAAIEE
jgi:aminoglycoside phosphotransferase (APT) family kinase protein